jgi:16S rRNA (cytosine1402-N4)-methyltransferase
MIDRDEEALDYARERLQEFDLPIRFVHAPFSQIHAILEQEERSAIGAIIADLGVSSHQLDSARRGFSFRQSGPLDMRQDRSQGQTAGEFLAEVSAGDLTRILRAYGEEPDAKRIAQAIVAHRPTDTFTLAQVVENAMSAPRRRKLGRRIHPATQTFQAIRIHLNRELEELACFLREAPQLLVVGGRLAVITFHSLEDREVKRVMRRLSQPPPLPAALPVTEKELSQPAFRLPPEFRRGVLPSEAEAKHNPRARSARLRVIERCAP